MSKSFKPIDLSDTAIEILKEEGAKAAIIRGISHRPINYEFVDALRTCCLLVSNKDEELAAFGADCINANKDGIEEGLAQGALPHGGSWSDDRYVGILEALYILTQCRNEELSLYAEDTIGDNDRDEIPSPTACNVCKGYAAFAYLSLDHSDPEQEPEQESAEESAPEQEPAIEPAEADKVGK